MKTRAELKAQAKQRLAGHWTDAVIFCLVYTIILSIVSGLAATGEGQNPSAANLVFMVVEWVITGPLLFALAKYFLLISRGKKAKIDVMVDGFKNFKNTFLLWLWRSIKVALWTFLLVIPGIIAALRYSQADFILVDHPELGPEDVLRRSGKMMKGHYFEYVMMILSFLGWAILATIPAGLGWLWLLPYMQTTAAAFYDDIKPSVADKLKDAGEKVVEALNS